MDGKVLIISVLVLLLTVNLVGAAYSQSNNQTSTMMENNKIPPWVKDNAKLWSSGSMSDEDFLKGINYLVNQTIIVIPPSYTATSGQTGVPVWIKHVAEWWAEGLIRDDDFVNGMQFLVANNIIHVQVNAPSANQAQTLTGKHLLIHIFSPNNPPALLAIFGRHLTPEDFTSNFQTRNLDLYPNIHHCLSAYSIDTIKTAITTAQTHSNVDCIDYDNEQNNGAFSSPSIEVSNPAASTNQAATLVKQAGLKFGAEPTFSLLKGEYQGVDWTNVDLVVMQTQGFKGSDSSFTSIVTTISDWIKSKNPNTLVFVQVNTAFDTTPHLISLIQSVSDKIDGVSVVIPNAATVEPLLVGVGR